MKKGKPNDLHEAFVLALNTVSRRWRVKLDERLRGAGQTQSRLITLLLLSRHGGGMLQKDLAAIIGIEGPTLVRILDSLEKRGLVERRQAKNDRRGKTVHVTAEAKPLLNRIEKTAKVLRQEILSNISAEQLTACLTVLEQIATNLEENSA